MAGETVPVLWSVMVVVDMVSFRWFLRWPVFWPEYGEDAALGWNPAGLSVPSPGLTCLVGNRLGTRVEPGLLGRSCPSSRE